MEHSLPLVLMCCEGAVDLHAKSCGLQDPPTPSVVQPMLCSGCWGAPPKKEGTKHCATVTASE